MVGLLGLLAVTQKLRQTWLLDTIKLQIGVLTFEVVFGMFKLQGSKKMDEILKAFNFAKEKHQGQVYHRDGGVPYITHCEEVFNTLKNLSNKQSLNLELLGQVAFLHDTLEDTQTTYEELVENFSKQVADGVLALSKNSELPREVVLRDSLIRIKSQPIEIHMVKMADRIANLQGINKAWDVKKSVSYLEDSKEILFFLSASHKELSSILTSSISKYKQKIDKLREKQQDFSRLESKDKVVYFRPENTNLFAFDNSSGITAEFVDQKWKLSKLSYLGILSQTSNIKFYTTEEALLLTKNKNPKVFFEKLQKFLDF